MLKKQKINAQKRENVSYRCDLLHDENQPWQASKTLKLLQPHRLLVADITNCARLTNENSIESAKIRVSMMQASVK